MKNNNNRKTGSSYEEVAAACLIKKGYEILERNFRHGSGEIDLIAKEGKTLIFVEVKYRKTAACGDPAEAVDHRKQMRIIRTAEYYMYTHHYNEYTPCRFDVVSILGEQIRIIQNAFETSY